MANPTDVNFEELFVRVVPVEVCCIHNGTSTGGSTSPNQQQQKPSPCLRTLQGSNRHSSAHFHDASMMPGTPTGARSCNGRNLDREMNQSGLYPTISSTEVGTCFCPSCCSNSYTAADQAHASNGVAGGGFADSMRADAGLSNVAVQRLTVRVLGQKTRYGANGRLLPGCYRVELSSDSSLFFLFLGTVTESGFLDIKEACDLSLSFQQLPGLLLQLLDLLVRQPSTYLARLMMQADGSAAMEFAQTLGFKTVSLLELPRLEPAGSAVVRGYVTARHNAILERCAGMEAELAELKALVRQRCPNLLLQATMHSKTGTHHSGRTETLA